MINIAVLSSNLVDNQFDSSDVFDIVFSTSITHIPNSVFFNCKKLKNIRLHDSVKYLGNSVF